jgi:hypothetical protein
MFDSKSVVTALEFSSQIPEMMRAAKGGSLIEYTRPTRVEPMTLVDLRAAQLPYIDEILSAGLNIFSAYYLQAVSLTVEVGNVNVLKLLDKFNPKRDLGRAAGDGASYLAKRLSAESFKHGLPFPGHDDGGITQSLEARQDDLEAIRKTDADKQENVSVGSGSIRDLNENGNLSVGKLLEITVKSEGQSATFPVQVRLMVSTLRPDLMAHTLSLGAKKTGVKERYHQWRSGQLKFWRDLVMAQDLIDEHRKNLVNDSGGFYKSQSKRGSSNKLAGLLSMNPSIGTASALIVMTTDTAKDLERAVRGRLKDFKTLEEIFKNTLSMMIFVIDPDYEQVTMYHQSIEEPTEVSIRQLQRSNNRGGGPDIMEILNAFRQAKSPTL